MLPPGGTPLLVPRSLVSVPPGPSRPPLGQQPSWSHIHVPPHPPAVLLLAPRRCPSWISRNVPPAPSCPYGDVPPASPGISAPFWSSLAPRCHPSRILDLQERPSWSLLTPSNNVPPGHCPFTRSLLAPRCHPSCPVTTPLLLPPGPVLPPGWGCSLQPPSSPSPEPEAPTGVPLAPSSPPILSPLPSPPEAASPSRHRDVLGDPVGLHQDSGCLGEIKPRGRHVTAAAVGFNPFEGCWAAAASNAGDNETIAAARGSCGHEAGTGTRGRGMLREAGAGGMAGCPWGGDGGGFFSSRLVLALGLPSC